MLNSRTGYRALFSFVLLTVFCLGLEAEAARRSRSSIKLKGSDSRQFRLGLGTGLVATGGSNGVGFNSSFMFRPSQTSPVYLGFETGLIIIGSGAEVRTVFGNVSVGGTGVMLPLLATAYYQFSINEPSFKPYLGGSIGGNIGLSNSGSSLAILFRPGANIFLSETVDLNVEARFGGLDGRFLINPQFNVALKF